MALRKWLGRFYWWGLKNFIFNDINEKILFPRGYVKKINNTPIRLSFKYSWIYPRNYEIEKADFIKSHVGAGDTVIDIGAHMGIFTFLLSKQVGPSGKVYSFEPTPLSFNLLQKSIRYNQLSNVVSFRAAVAEKEGEIIFYLNDAVSKGNSISSNNAIEKSIQVKHEKIITVKTLPLDSLLGKEKIENLKLIKIDAEGAELQILKGGKELIRKFRPYITLEIHPNSFEDTEKAMSELYAIISEYKYKIISSVKELSKEEFENYSTFFEVFLVPL